MKQALSLVALLFSINGLACVNFSGRWECRDSKQLPQIIKITQTNLEFTYESPKDMVDFIADDVEREISIEVRGNLKPGTSLGFCQSISLMYSEALKASSGASELTSLLKLYRISTKEMMVVFYKNLFPGDEIFVADCKKL